MGTALHFALDALNAAAAIVTLLVVFGVVRPAGNSARRDDRE